VVAIASHVGLFIMLPTIEQIQRKVDKPVKNMIKKIETKEWFMSKNIKNPTQRK